MPWDRPVLLAACDGRVVRLSVCVRHETLTDAVLRTVAPRAGLRASLGLAYIAQDHYTAGILIRSPATSCGSHMLARGSGDSSLDCWDPRPYWRVRIVRHMVKIPHIREVEGAEFTKLR